RRMKQFFTVFRFTYMDAVKKKAFIISTAILLVLILVACLIPKGIALFSGDSAGEEAVDFASAPYLQYLDENNLIPGGEKILSDALYNVAVIAKEEASKAEQLVKDGELDAFIRITGAEGNPEIGIYIRDFMHSPDTGAISNLLTSAWRTGEMQKAGADENVIALSNASLPVFEAALGGMDLTGYTLGIIVSMLMFFAVYFYGISVANSVAMEKTSRVMETLVISAKPSAILAGKCFAMGAAGLTQMAGVILYAVLCFKLLVPAGTTILGMELSFAGVTALNLIFLILYFLLGYALYAMMYAVCGATVSRIEDVSPALMPVSMITMIGFYVGYFTSIMGSGGGWIEFAARYVPFCAPFGMPFRLLNGSATPKEAVISLLVMLGAIFLISAFCVRMYKASVMHYGKRLKLKDLLKIKA
ncbi:MAG: ABC transporter permease, partial [Clostridia bacterium]|nr:ABC transporter permease [Clostridia bacterium]